MGNGQATIIVTIGWLLIASTAVGSEDPAKSPQDLSLTPGLKTLLRAEMRDVASGMAALTAALASADWKTMATTAGRIRDSYLLDQELSDAQRQELARVLPEGFRQIDDEFHRRADKLASAATSRDGELAAFHFYRLVESCVICHSRYARARFPGFAAQEEHEHRH